MILTSYCEKGLSEVWSSYICRIWVSKFTTTIIKKMRNTIRTLVAEEMYYSSTFSRAKQHKTIHDDMNYMKGYEYIMKRKFYPVVEKSFMEWNLD